jgi:hypothetical protein
VDKGKKYGAVFRRYGFLDGEGGMVRIGDETRVSRRNNETTAFYMWLTYPESNPKHINAQLTGSKFGPDHFILNVVVCHIMVKIQLTNNITFGLNSKISCLRLSLLLKYLDLLSPTPDWSHEQSSLNTLMSGAKSPHHTKSCHVPASDLFKVLPGLSVFSRIFQSP